MTMGLREELAASLKQENECAQCDVGMEWWLMLADEVIRQMRWTHMSAKWANPETMSWDVEVMEDGDPGLTLAPPEWKP